MSNYIYKPQGPAREFGASMAFNPYTTCGHGCSYCCAPLALRKGRAKFYDPTPRKIDFKALCREARRKAANGWTEKGPILLSFACDPFQPLEEEEHATAKSIGIFKRAGFSIVILTKDLARAWKYAEDLAPRADRIGTTFTTLDSYQAAAWEPRAPHPVERLEALKRFHDAGFFTWVSLEPLIDPRQVKDIIRKTAGWVDHYKIGMLNYGNTCPRVRDIAAKWDWKKTAWDIMGVFADYGFHFSNNPDDWQHRSYYRKESFRRELHNVNF